MPRSDRSLSRRAAHDAALPLLPRAAASALSDPAQGPSHRRTRRARAVRRRRAAASLYVSNHKSHLDYLIEPLVLDDNGIRPPVLAAGINLFGGPLGLLHRHVTGAIPIRRNSKDPLYLVTLRAYIAELLNRRDLLYYAEGGRSYSGELQLAQDRPAPGRAAGRPHRPVDRADGGRLRPRPRRTHHLARGDAPSSQRPFSQEVAEMVRHAVGYQSRAFVTFGPAIPLVRLRPGVAARSRDADPSRPRRHRAAVQGVADGARRRGHAAGQHCDADLVGRVDELLAVLARRGREPGRQIRAAGGRRRPRAARRTRHRRRRIPAGATRACATASCSATTRGPFSTCCTAQGPRTDARSAVEGDVLDCSPAAARSRSSHRATACGGRAASRAGSWPASTVEEAIECATRLERDGLTVTLDHLGERVTIARSRYAATREYMAMVRGGRRGRHQPEPLGQAHAARPRHRPRDLGRQHAPRARRGATGGLLRAHRHGGIGLHRRRRSKPSRLALGHRLPQHRRRHSGVPEAIA